MGLVMLDSSVVLDRNTLVAQARGLGCSLLQQVFIQQIPETSTPNATIQISFSQEGAIALATLLHQLADQAAKVKQS